MIKIDHNLLTELGLGDLPVEDKNRLLAHIYETLEIRVGMTLAKQMSEEQLSEFESFIDKKDDKGALSWLETNFPDYKSVVAQQLESLKSEIKQSSQKIIDAAESSSDQIPEQNTA